MGLPNDFSAQGKTDFSADHADSSEYSCYALDFQLALNEPSSSAYEPSYSSRSMTSEALTKPTRETLQQLSSQYYDSRHSGPALKPSDQSSRGVSQAGQQTIHVQISASKLDDNNLSRTTAASSSLQRGRPTMTPSVSYHLGPNDQRGAVPVPVQDSTSTYVVESARQADMKKYYHNRRWE